ncbi:MAG: aminopeptidase P N-terminal domain-containing protein [Bryobacteraceae bacterium]
MRKCVALCCLMVLPLLADAVPLDEYKQRRASLQKSLGDAITILFGHTEKDHGDLRSPFFQEPNFYYLTGWNEPGAVLVLTRIRKFSLPGRDIVQEKWTGPKLAPGDRDGPIKQDSQVLLVETFEANLPKWLEAPQTLHSHHATLRADA